MDKSTLSNYGWVVIAVLVISVMVALATPFGQFISNGVKSTTIGLTQAISNSLGIEMPNEEGMIIGNSGNNTATTPQLIGKPQTTAQVNESKGYAYGAPRWAENPLLHFETTQNAYAEMQPNEDDKINATGAKITLYKDSSKSEIIKEYTYILFGDVDCDGIINITDCGIIEQHIHNRNKITDDAKIFAADVVPDGIIDQKDSDLIYRHAAYGIQMPLNVHDTTYEPTIIGKNGANISLNDDLMVVYGVPENSNIEDYLDVTNNGALKFNTNHTGKTNGTYSPVVIHRDSSKREVANEYYLVIFGDVDCDSKITENDITAIEKHLDGEEVFDDEVLEFAADVNADGLIDENDIEVIRNHINGIATIKPNIYA